MKNKAVYAGTFDPITNGHLWVIKEAAELFDLTILVADNPEKRLKTMFGVGERCTMIREVLDSNNLKNVEVLCGTENDSYTVVKAKELGANYVIRGIRNADDFSKEHIVRQINEDICPSVKTLFLVPPRNLSEISSGMVKGLVGFSGWRDVVSKYVPSNVVKRMLSKNLDLKKVMIRLGSSVKDADIACVYVNKEYGNALVRHYHDGKHIKSCIDKLYSFVDDDHIDARMFDILACAIYFHDVVYVPTANDNEEKSVEFFKKFSRGISGETVSFISTLIMSTKTHSASFLEEWYMVDIDMSILGSDYDSFLEYEHGIREEYWSVEDSRFYPARKALLEGWLNSTVFNTSNFRNKYEEQKNYNIKRLLERPEYANLAKEIEK